MKYNHGNYAIYEDHIIRLEVLDLLNIQAAALEGVEPYQPVPITPQLLQRLGIHRDLHAFSPTFQLADVLVVHIFDNEIKLWIRGCSKTIQYIHQLQNLYTAIEEKELVFTQTPPNP